MVVLVKCGVSISPNHDILKDSKLTTQPLALNCEQAPRHVMWIVVLWVVDPQRHSFSKTPKARQRAKPLFRQVHHESCNGLLCLVHYVAK